MRALLRQLIPVLVAVGAIAACPAIAAAWGPPRSGGLGHQVLRGGSGADYLRGAEGPDTVRGYGGGDLLTGDTGPDGISGGSGSDTISGGAGNDIVLGGSGNDIAFGGFGADTIRGDGGDDALAGDNDGDKLSGGAGNDVLHGGSGIDTLDGGTGNDRIFSDSGADTIDAGAGDDTIVVDAESKVRINCGVGNDTLYLSVTAEATADYTGRGVSAYYSGNCETVWLTDALPDPNKGITYLATDAGGKREGTARDDTLLGGPGADALQGGAGNDVLWGLRQPDVKSVARDYLLAGNGDDTVYGGPGPQVIDGGPGDDFLESGIGNGTITGGTGDDTIRMRGGGLTMVDAGSGNDTIYARGTARARITCGRGRDVAHADAGDRVARDCERIIGGAKRSKGRLRATYRRHDSHDAGARALVPPRRGAPLGYNVHLVDQVASSSGSYYGELGASGVTDDGDTSFQSNTNYYVGDPSVSLGIYDGFLHEEFSFEAWYRSADSGTRGRCSAMSLRVQPGHLPRPRGGRLAARDHPLEQRHEPEHRPAHAAARSRCRELAPHRADARRRPHRDLRRRRREGRVGPAMPIAFETQNYGVGVGARLGAYKGWEGGIDEIAIYDRAARRGDDRRAFPRRRRRRRAGRTRRSAARAAAAARRRHPPEDRPGRSRASTARSTAPASRPARPTIRSLDVPDGRRTRCSCSRRSRTGVLQAVPTVLRFRVDASLPSTILALRLAPENDGRAIVTFGSDSAVGFECRFARGTFGPALEYVPCAAPMDVEPGSIMEVRAVDSAGNRDPTPAFVSIPPAGIGFNFGPVLPTFAGGRAEAQLSGEWFFSPNFQCRIDGHAWAACPTQLRLPLLDPGVHTLQVRQPIVGGAMATTAPMVWTVSPRPGRCRDRGPAAAARHRAQRAAATARAARALRAQPPGRRADRRAEAAQARDQRQRERQDRREQREDPGAEAQRARSRALHGARDGARRDRQDRRAGAAAGDRASAALAGPGFDPGARGGAAARERRFQGCVAADGRI